MPKDVTKHSTMMDLQGDLVLVLPDRALLTIVRVVDTDKQWLVLVDRTEKKKVDYGELSQAMFDQMSRFTDPKEPRIRWKLDL